MGDLGEFLSTGEFLICGVGQGCNPENGGLFATNSPPEGRVRSDAGREWPETGLAAPIR